MVENENENEQVHQPVDNIFVQRKEDYLRRSRHSENLSYNALSGYDSPNAKAQG